MFSLAIFFLAISTVSYSYADTEYHAGTKIELNAALNEEHGADYNTILKFDLKKSISFAFDNSPVFDSLKRQLKISLLDEKSAEAKLYPSLDLTTTHGILDSSPRSATVTTVDPLVGQWHSEFNLGITESLYDNGVSRTNSQIATLNRKQAELHFEDQKNKLSLDIVSQYLTYSLNTKLLEIQEKQFKLLSKQFDSISRAYHQGIKTKKDFLRFKTQIGRGEINVVSAKAAVEKSKQELQRLIGINLRINSDIQFTPISFETVKNELLSEKIKSEKIKSEKIKIENHYQYRIAQIQKEANLLSADLVERKYLPEWFLSTGVNYTSSNYIGSGQSFSDNAQTGWNVLLTVKYNFFDWGIRSRDKQVAIHRSVVQGNELDADLLFLKSSISQLIINAKQIQKNFSLVKEVLALEKTNIDFIEQEYRNGKVQYLDLITGLNNISDAEMKYYMVVSDLLTAKYTILYHQGKLYEELLK